MAIQVVTDPAVYKRFAEFGIDRAPDPQASYDQAVAVLNGSNTGRKILDTVADPFFPINVFVTDVFSSMFLHATENTLPIEGSIVTWQANYRLCVKGQYQEPYMGLVHELGHAVQYIENQGWYNTYANWALSSAHDCIGGKGRTAQLVIENRNIKSHESPVAQELGQPMRDQY